MFNDDCDALATHARNRLQSNPDARCQDSHRHFPLSPKAGVRARLPCGSVRRNVCEFDASPSGRVRLNVHGKSGTAEERALVGVML